MAIHFEQVADNVPSLGGGDPGTVDPLTPGETSFLRLLARNSKFSIRPKCVALPRGRRAAHPQGPLSIATVSTSLLAAAPGQASLDVPAHLKPVSRSGDRYRLFALENQLALDDMRRFLSTALLDAGRKLLAFEREATGGRPLVDASRLVVVNEFGFPFPLEPEERSAFLDEVERAMVADPDMLDFWSSCYVVFGTYHCHSEMKNSAVISLPYRPGEIRVGGEVVGGEVQEFMSREIGAGGDHHGERFNFTQDKFCAAEKIGERLVPRAKIDWTYYDTNMGRIGVLICFDALDPRMLLRLAMLQMSDTNIRVTRFSAIVVPSFSPNDRVFESCRLISEVLGCLVVYVNVQYAAKERDALHVPRPDMPRPTSHAYFHAGLEITGQGIGGAWSAEAEPSVVWDEDKNLWHSTRFCHIDRSTLRESEAAFSPAFREIFGAGVL